MFGEQAVGDSMHSHVLASGVPPAVVYKHDSPTARHIRLASILATVDRVGMVAGCGQNTASMAKLSALATLFRPVCTNDAGFVILLELDIARLKPGRHKCYIRWCYIPARSGFVETAAAEEYLAGAIDGQRVVHWPNDACVPGLRVSKPAHTEHLGR